MKKVQFIWAHPRANSLTAHVVETMKSHALSKGMEVAELDLYRSNFNPVMYEIEEPKWVESDYEHTEEVQMLFDSLKGVDTLFIVFPVWWYSFPAILKGYIDKVWTNGLAYGQGTKLPVNKIRWVALAGEPRKAYEEKGNGPYMEHLMNKNLAEYCGITDSKVEFLFDTIGFTGDRDEAHYQRIFTQANRVVDEI